MRRSVDVGYKDRDLTRPLHAVHWEAQAGGEAPGRGPEGAEERMKKADASKPRN